MSFKNCIKVCLVALSLCFCLNLRAQDKGNPWSFALGMSALDVATGSTVGWGAIDYVNWSGIDLFPSANLKVSRHIIAGLAIGLEGHFNFVTEKQLNHIDVEKDKQFTAFGGNLALDYHFPFLKIFDPYITLGAGYSMIGEQGNVMGNAGLGLNLWVTKHIGLNFQTSYRTSSLLNKTFEDVASPTYFQHSFGINIRLGAKDTDGDGIIDSKDECKEEKGRRSTKGCPDKDGDGIRDSEDECPDEKGPKSTKGCPDKDGDGIRDSEDECPDEPGTEEKEGCPEGSDIDTDVDGVIDKDDLCPKEPGTKENDGCPEEIEDKVDEKSNQDPDGDGVLGDDDECPDKKGSKENLGCPKQVNVYFDKGSSSIARQHKSKLYSIAKIIKSYSPEKKILIKGHCDETGSDALNARLSLLRAYNVRQYLVQQGADGNMILIAGYGSKLPIGNNDNNSSRRVEIVSYTEDQKNANTIEGLSRIHKVASGETLNTIAKKYNIPVKTLKLINGIRRSIRKGMILILDYIPNIQGSLNEMKPFEIGNNSISRSVSRRVNNRLNRHKVKRNDTLNSLAKKYNTTVEKLQRLNGLVDDKIRLGSFLRIR